MWIRSDFKTQPPVNQRFRPAPGGCHCLEQFTPTGTRFDLKSSLKVQRYIKTDLGQVSACKFLTKVDILNDVTHFHLVAMVITQGF